MMRWSSVTSAGVETWDWLRTAIRSMNRSAATWAEGPGTQGVQVVGAGQFPVFEGSVRVVEGEVEELAEGFAGEAEGAEGAESGEELEGGPTFHVVVSNAICGVFRISTRTQPR